MPDPIHPFLTPSRRAHIYRIAVAVVPLLILGGWLTDEIAAHVLGVIAAVLSTGVAAAHTPRDG